MMTAKERVKMSEDMYANVEVIEENRADLSDHDNSGEEDADKLESQRARELEQTGSSGINCAGNKYCRGTAVFLLVVLYFVLKTALLCTIMFNNLNTKKNQLQTSHNNLTNQKDQIQVNYSDLISERDHLQASYLAVIKERDSLRKQIQMECKCFNSKLYYISTERKNWTESRQDCIKKGLDLMIINSKEEQTFVNNLSKRKQPGVYIGLTEHNEGWKWVDGTSMTTANWSSEKTSLGDEGCGVIGYNRSDGWYSRPCKEVYYRICE